ncbi:MAG: TIGR00725 family protein [Pelovirga sp.]
MKNGAQQLIIGVIGAGDASENGRKKAYQVGRQVAERGAVLACGGLGGVMEAAAQGCFEAGGEVIGILPGDSAATANAYVTHPVVTAMGHARNIILVQTSAALIAVEGGYGTLSEIAVACKIGKPVVLLDSWADIDDTLTAESASEAVAMVFNLLGRGD